MINDQTGKMVRILQSMVIATTNARHMVIMRIYTLFEAQWCNSGVCSMYSSRDKKFQTKTVQNCMDLIVKVLQTASLSPATQKATTTITKVLLAHSWTFQMVGPKVGGSDNKYECPIIDVFRMLTFQLPTCRERNV